LLEVDDLGGSPSPASEGMAKLVQIALKQMMLHLVPIVSWETCPVIFSPSAAYFPASGLS